MTRPPEIPTPEDLIAPADFQAPARYRDPYLRNLFATALKTPPVIVRRGRRQRYDASGWYEAFWKGYDDVGVQAAKGEPGTVRRAIYMAGKERRRLERAGKLPSLDGLDRAERTLRNR